MARRLLIAFLAASALTTPACAQTAATAPMPAAAVASVSPESEADFRRAADRVVALMEAAAATPGAAPAMSMVLVRRGQPPLVWVRGRLSADADAPAADADTPFYIASQTKAFVGLLAVKLDAEGVFDLDQTLTDIWPDLTFPPGADASAITFRQLLSHQGPFENEPLGFRTAYSDRVPVSDYGRLLQTASTARAPGFQYSNLGYLIYGAALEVKTGRDWRDWLDAELLRPAGMTRTGTRPSSLDGLPRYQRWMGEAGWDVFGGKPDALMHAAGGLVVSPDDMTRWLSIQLGEANDAVRPEWVRIAQTQQVAAEIRGDVVGCQGYALGWNICHLGRVDVRVHGGAYTGVRSAMAVSPELGVAIAFMSNSDSLTGGLSQVLVQTFFESVQDPDYAGMTAETFGPQYVARLSRFAEGRMAEVARTRADPQWGGWTWTPSVTERADYVGLYRHPTMGELAVTTDGQGLRFTLGALTQPLQPATPDVFGLSDGPPDPPTPVRFERADGRVAAVTWGDLRFERVDQGLDGKIRP